MMHKNVRVKEGGEMFRYKRQEGVRRQMGPKKVRCHREVRGNKDWDMEIRYG